MIRVREWKDGVEIGEAFIDGDTIVSGQLSLVIPPIDPPQTVEKFLFRRATSAGNGQMLHTERTGLELLDT